MKTQFKADLEKQIRVNDGYMSVGVYNLLVSIRDVKLYRIGLKPHRHWKISQVKTYFGIKGNKDTILDELNRLKEQLK
jgi:hypothetical protein